jgi:hypothetical protein
MTLKFGKNMPSEFQELKHKEVYFRVYPDQRKITKNAPSELARFELS